MTKKTAWKRKEVIGDCTLYLGDCLQVLPVLGKADLCLTDPPYGINIASNPVRQKHEKKAWDKDAATVEAMSAMRSASSEQIIWGGNYFDLPPSRGFLVWDKKQPENFSLAMCEMAWWSKDTNAKVYSRSVLGYDKSHPTQKPVQLMEWCLSFVPAARVVLDPYMGSGTTGVACVKAGRSFVGIEIDEGYFEIACERIRDAYSQPDMFVSSLQPKPEQLSILDGAA
jgi:DNA modification methylase